jgi:hypothetical protein
VFDLLSRKEHFVWISIVSLFCSTLLVIIQGYSDYKFNKSLFDFQDETQLIIMSSIQTKEDVSKLLSYYESIVGFSFIELPIKFQIEAGVLRPYSIILDEEFKRDNLDPLNSSMDYRRYHRKRFFKYFYLSRNGSIATAGNDDSKKIMKVEFSLGEIVKGKIILFLFSYIAIFLIFAGGSYLQRKN